MVTSVPAKLTINELGPPRTLSVSLIKNSPLTSTLTGAVIYGPAPLPMRGNITDDESVP